MLRLTECVQDWDARSEAIRAARCGVIEVADERWVAVHLRPWGRRASLAEVIWRGRFGGARPSRTKSRRRNRCLLYYQQPRFSPGYLALTYVVSTAGTTLATFRGSLIALDEIARLKHADAIVCEASNLRISDRLLTRWGWTPHLPDSRRRHFIKRFYGEYPARDPAWERLMFEPSAE